MDAVTALCLKDIDPVMVPYVIAENTLDLAVMIAERDYFLESGLNSLEYMGIVTESPEASGKEENSIIKAIKSICDAIRNLIQHAVEAFGNLFNNDNLTVEDFFSSPQTQINLEKDAKEIDAIVRDEIRKGNALLQKVSSKTGVSDEVIDDWVRKSSAKLKKVGPIVVSAAAAFGFRLIIKKGLKSWKGENDKAEKTSTSGDNSDPKKNKQKITILKHMKKIGSALIKESIALSNIISKESKRQGKKRRK